MFGGQHLCRHEILIASTVSSTVLIALGHVGVHHECIHLLRRRLLSDRRHEDRVGHFVRCKKN